MRTWEKCWESRNVRALIRRFTTFISRKWQFSYRFSTRRTKTCKRNHFLPSSFCFKIFCEQTLQGIFLRKWCAEQNRQLLHYSTKLYGSAKYVGHHISSLRVAAPSPFVGGRVRLHVGYYISSLVFKESPGGHLLITVLMLNYFPFIRK